MSLRRFTLPLLALTLAAASTYGVRSWLEERRTPSPAAPVAAKPVTKGVLVAARELEVGQFVQPDDVRWQRWPDVDIPESYFVEGRRTLDDVVGAVLRRPTVVGSPIVSEDVVKPGDRGFLAAVLDPDMRAISVPVDDASSNAGLIFPGDHVDVLLTQSLSSGDGGTLHRRVSETVLHDVRVLAMGRRLTSGEGEEGAVNAQARTATLEVTPAAAEKVALVTELGRLSLSLRSLARREPTLSEHGALPRPTWDADVSPALRPENQPTATMALIRGPEAQIIPIRRGASQ